MVQSNFTLINNRIPSIIEAEPALQSTGRNFIEANTVPVTLQEIREDHIIPVFARDNQPLISHSELIDLTSELVMDHFPTETVLAPNIRMSHVIKGRVPEAKHKPASMLQPWETTMYYERMMFTVEVPCITDFVDGNQLSLTIGGVKAYNQDNLFGRTQGDQHFKLFIGFKNKVCSNLCVWSDGLVDDFKVRNVSQLRSGIRALLESYNPELMLRTLKKLPEYQLSEKQFAQFLGKCRMYPYLSNDTKQQIPLLQFGDQQIGAVAREYFKDPDFSRDEESNVSLWRLYNLFTGSNTSSYIDSFLQRSVNALELIEHLRGSLDGKHSWYLG